MSKDILFEYCKKAIDILEEARGRKRVGGLSMARKKPGSTKPVKQTQAFSKGDLREVYHKPVILSILDDVSDTELDHYLPVKDFVAFTEPGFQENYEKKRFKDTGDAFGLFTYKMSKRDYEDIEIGRKKDPVIIPVNYVLASDIIDNSANLNDKSFKRRYGSEQGYIFTSTLTRENIQNALSKYGLSAVGIDIVDIDNDEEIEKKFVKKFDQIGWRKYLENMGYTPTRSRSEIKSIRQVYGLDATSAEVASDDSAHAAALTNAKREFNDMIKIGIASGQKAYPNVFVLADLAKQNDDEVPWTFGVWIQSWASASGINSMAFKNTLFSVNDPENPNDQEIIKFKKALAESYLSWLSRQRNYVASKESQPKLNPSASNNAYDLIKEAATAFSNLINSDEDIETDSQGNLVNLTQQQEALYYRSIFEDYKFKLFTLPYLKTKEYKIDNAFVSDRPGETRAQYASRASDARAHQADHNARIEFGKEAKLGKRNYKKGYENIVKSKLKK